MKYTYFYKTGDGVRHAAEMDAESREAVFAALRANGIKAIKVVAADGSKANGEVRGVRKRVAAGIAVSAALFVGLLTYTATLRLRPAPSSLPPHAAPRHQIYGDPAVVGEFACGHFDAVLSNRTDRILAWFAQPGRVSCPKGVNPLQMPEEFADAASGLTDAAGRLVLLEIAADEPREVRELKQIVNGLRAELQLYLANGNGTPRSYWRRLVERTEKEMRIYERTRRELENETSAETWERKNAALRQLGLRSIPNPNEDD